MDLPVENQTKLDLNDRIISGWTVLVDRPETKTLAIDHTLISIPMWFVYVFQQTVSQHQLASHKMKISTRRCLETVGISARVWMPQPPADAWNVGWVTLSSALIPGSSKAQSCQLRARFLRHARINGLQRYHGFRGNLNFVSIFAHSIHLYPSMQVLFPVRFPDPGVFL